MIRLLLPVIIALLAANVCTAAPQVSVTESAKDVVVQIDDLDQLRRKHPALRAEIQLDGIDVVYKVDFTAPYQTPAVLIRKADPRQIGTVAVMLFDGNQLIHSDLAATKAIAASTPRLPLTNAHAVIEPGKAMTQAPAIRQPDMAQLPSLGLSDAARVVKLDDIAVRVVSDISYPLMSANNNCLISRQTSHPDDPNKRSVYVALKSQIYDAAGNPGKVIHYLCEVPIDPAWGAITDEADITLDPSRFKVHIPTDKWKNGQLVTGEGAGGLGQMVGSATVDDDGNLYYSASQPTGQFFVRFNIAKAKFEAPPIDVSQVMNKHVPPKAKMPPQAGGRSPIWDPIMYLAIGNGRVYLTPMRHDYVYADVFWLNGVFSFPLEHWYSAPRFAAGARFLAGSIPGTRHALYEQWPAEDEPTYKLGPGFFHDGAYYTESYPPFFPKGPWRIDLNPDGSMKSIEVLTGDKVAELSKTRRESLPRLATTAHRLFDWQDYGVLRTTSGQIRQTLHGGEPDASANAAINIYYDPLSAMRADPSRYAEILGSQKGPALAPCYMAVEIPDKPGHLLGVSEYGYYLAEFDLTTAAQGVVTKRFLKLDLGSLDNVLPVKVGLGPYGRLWWRDGDKQYLLPIGYTGVSAMLYGEGGKALEKHKAILAKGAEVRSLDGATAGPSMTHTYPLHGLDNRVYMAATNTPSRSGNPYSNGLQAFTAPLPKEVLRLSKLSRARGNGWLRSRVIFEPDGRKRQQLALGASMPIPTYLEMLHGKDLPAHNDAAMLMYECMEGEEPMDVLSFSLPVVDGRSGINGQVFSRDGRYLITSQQGRLLSFDMAEWRYVDGHRLDADIWEFTRPDYRFNVAPDGGIYICVQEPNAAQATLYEVVVSDQGMISLRPHVTMQAPTADKFKPLQGAVIAFIADPSGDGSYDLCIGPWSRMPNSRMHIIPDFVPARTGSR